MRCNLCGEEVRRCRQYLQHLKTVHPDYYQSSSKYRFYLFLTGAIDIALCLTYIFWYFVFGLSIFGNPYGLVLVGVTVLASFITAILLLVTYFKLRALEDNYIVSHALKRAR